LIHTRDYRPVTSALLRRTGTALFFAAISAGTTVHAQNPNPNRITGDQIRILTNIQTGSTYTIVQGDCGKLLSFTNSNPVAVTLPQAGQVILPGCWIELQNSGAGTLTLTPTISTVDGLASVALASGSGLRLVSANGQYYTERGTGGGSGGVSVASAGQLGYYPSAGSAVSGAGCTVGGLENSDLTCNSFTSNGTVQGELDLFPANSTSYVGVSAPASVPTTYTLQLPGSAPANQLLSFGVPVSGIAAGSWINIPTGGGAAAGSVYCAGSGINTITCAGAPAPASYTAGLTVSLHAGGTNTGAMTLNIAGIGAANILLNGAPVGAGQVVLGYSYSLYYDGSEFNFINPSIPGIQTVFNTTNGTCSPSCSAASTGYGPGGNLPGITITDNFGLPAGQTRVISGADTSGGVAPYPEWGGASASASFRDILNNSNSVVIPFTAAAAGTLTDALPGMGAPGPPGSAGTAGPSGANGTNGSNGANGTNGATGPPGPVSFAANPQTSTYQAQPSDFASCKSIPVSSGTFTITLVASSSQPASGQCVLIMNYGSGVVTVAGSGQNVNGAASNLTIAAGSASTPNSLLVISDGANYTAQPIIGGAAAGSGAAGSGAAGVSAAVTLSSQFNLPAVNSQGTDKTLATYTMPANTLPAGGCVGIKAATTPSVTTNTFTYKLWFGTTSATMIANTSFVTWYWSGWDEIRICNSPGVTNAQTWWIPPFSYSSGLNSFNYWASAGAPGTTVTSAIDTTAPVAIKITVTETNSGAMQAVNMFTIGLR
jgi:hypothetical protein